MRSTGTSQPPAFGEQIRGQTYIPRPGAYAVSFDSHWRVAVMRNNHGYFLPGGGIEPQETLAECLRREIREECGYEIRLGQQVGEAVDYIATREGQFFCIHGTFFLAIFLQQVASPVDEDHALVWLPWPEAVRKLIRPGQAWAVRQAQRNDHIPGDGDSLGAR